MAKIRDALTEKQRLFLAIRPDYDHDYEAAMRVGYSENSARSGIVTTWRKKNEAFAKAYDEMIWLINTPTPAMLDEEEQAIVLVEEMSPSDLQDELQKRLPFLFNTLMSLVAHAKSETVKLRALEKALELAGVDDMKSRLPQVQQNFFLLQEKLGLIAQKVDPGYMLPQTTVDAEFSEVEDTDGDSA